MSRSCLITPGCRFGDGHIGACQTVPILRAEVGDRSQAAQAVTGDYVLRWTGHQLVTADGGAATNAQRQKAERYLKAGLINPGPSYGQATSWGEATWTEEHYLLEPVPGCKVQQRVVVKTWIANDGTTTAIDYRCSCQRAAGSATRSPGGCSHALAIHLYRKDAQ